MQYRVIALLVIASKETLHPFPVQYLEIEIEARLELSLPFCRQMRGRNDKYPFQRAAGTEFRQNEAGLDCFTKTDFVGDQQAVVFRFEEFENGLELLIFT